MVDAHAAVLGFLETNLPGVTIAAAVETAPKGYKPSDGSLIVFKARGGNHAYEADHLFPSMQFKCYGLTELAAMTLYRSLFDTLNHSSGAGVKWAESEVLGQPLYEPDTGWPYVLAFFNVTVANI